MRQVLLNFLPTPLLILVFILGLGLFGLFMHYIAHRYFSNYLLKGSLQTGNVMMSMSTLSTLILGFTIIVLWQFFTSTRMAIKEEASALNEIVMYSQTFPSTVQQKIHDAAKNYRDVVINEEWYLMGQGQESTLAQERLKQIYDAIKSYRATSTNDGVYLEQIIQSYSTLLSSRNHRIDAIESVMPTVFFRAIILNMLILLTAISFLDDQNRRAQRLFIMFVAIMLGVNLSLTIMMDYPYSGQFLISSEPFTSDFLGDLK